MSTLLPLQRLCTHVRGRRRRQALLLRCFSTADYPPALTATTAPCCHTGTPS